MKLLVKKIDENSTLAFYLMGFKIFSYKMKLGVSYNLFDGEELLESSVKSIRQQVDYINVVYQKVSNFGEPATPNIELLLQTLKDKGLIDEIYLYTPKFSDAHKNEKTKRDIGLKLARKAGCTHFMSMDVDEYYKANELAEAKKFILKNKIKASACCIIEYLKSPTYQMVNGYTFCMNKDFYTFYVPFIMKIRGMFGQKHGDGDFPCLVDPTRKLNGNKKFYLFPAHDIAMHHMSSIRRDLARKYNSSNLMNSNSDVQKYVRSVQQQILDFDFEKNKKYLSDYSIFNQSLVREVDNVFDIH